MVRCLVSRLRSCPVLFCPVLSLGRHSRRSPLPFLAATRYYPPRYSKYLQGRSVWKRYAADVSLLPTHRRKASRESEEGRKGGRSGLAPRRQDR
ncbi:hypothetical protein LX32DRAFT_267485 [Colletotrichum zoysiae]|uniref:Uncharacterized protein n=1 Tax=Colletotrichum zoysiae TaxID=1216348 RepID=A0AAD9HMB9_9PEZI|nr:hypothetical protein LX32DRAFT_267485 [Colletotrichum zoysiae]